MFPPRPDGQTDRYTYGRTDISIYRVTSLLETHAHLAFRVFICINAKTMKYKIRTILSKASILLLKKNTELKTTLV